MVTVDSVDGCLEHDENISCSFVCISLRGVKA